MFDNLHISKPRWGRQLPIVHFVPLRISDALPWLILATSLRYLAKLTESPLALLIIAPATTFFLLVSFVIIVSSAFKGENGYSLIDRNRFWSTFKRILPTFRRIFEVTFYVLILLFILWFWDGKDSILASELGGGLITGFSGLGFVDGKFPARVFGAIYACLISILVMLTVAGRSNSIPDIWDQCIQHARYLVPAFIVGVVVTHVIKEWQLNIARNVDPAFAYHWAQGLFYIAYTSLTGLIRMWILAYVFTTALRLSFRSLQSEQ